MEKPGYANRTPLRKILMLFLSLLLPLLPLVFSHVWCTKYQYQCIIISSYSGCFCLVFLRCFNDFNLSLFEASISLFFAGLPVCPWDAGKLVAVASPVSRKTASMNWSWQSWHARYRKIMVSQPSLKVENLFQTSLAFQLSLAIICTSQFTLNAWRRWSWQSKPEHFDWISDYSTR